MRHASLVLSMLLAVLLVPLPVAADARLTTALVIDVGMARSGEDAPVGVTLTDPNGAPMAGVAVLVERRVTGVWQPLANLATDGAGRAATALRLSALRDDNVVRATYAGDVTNPPVVSGDAQIEFVRRRSTVSLKGPSRVVDEQEIELAVKWTADDGTAAAGEVRLQQRDKGRWRVLAREATDAAGEATFVIRPRTDVVLRLKTSSLDWVEAAQSTWKRIDNLPPERPVRLGRGVPRPRIHLPSQERARGAGAAAVVTRIPDGVWRSMVGRTWHPGCPVGRDGLRLLRVNYVDFDGYRRRGELVVAASAASQFAGAFTEFHNRGIPIRSMYRVDRFGWSSRLQGADDVASMASGNTSAFNCRHVVGRPGVASPHTYGRALDLNTWENPYRVNGRWLPSGWWAGRSHPRVAWRNSSHIVVRILRRHGFSWTYGVTDSQHFDARTTSGRVVARCATVCH